MNCSLNVHDAARQYCKYMENKNEITVQTGSNGSFHTSITYCLINLCATDSSSMCFTLTRQEENAFWDYCSLITYHTNIDHIAIQYFIIIAIYSLYGHNTIHKVLSSSVLILRMVTMSILEDHCFLIQTKWSLAH